MQNITSHEGAPLPHIRQAPAPPAPPCPYQQSALAALAQAARSVA